MQDDQSWISFVFVLRSCLVALIDLSRDSMVSQVVVGLAIGCELMDLCFDFLIHWDTPLKIGDRTISAREAGGCSGI